MGTRRLRRSRWDKLATGRDIYQVRGAPTGLLDQAILVLQDRFGFDDIYRAVGDADLRIVIGGRRGVRLLLGWDIWSGFYAIADSEEADLYVAELGMHFEEALEAEAAPR